jgi:hypothetical protein
VESTPLPEDVDQDEVDVAVERVRACMETAIARAGLTNVVVRVRTEPREGRLWVVGEVQPLPPEKS